jgi:hypothetical protein
MISTENWDDDFESQKSSTNTHDDHPRISFASTTTTDWDRNPDEHKNKRPPHTPSRITTENWDDDFEDSNSPKHLVAFPPPPSNPTTPSRPKGQLRPESWDDQFQGTRTRSSPLAGPRTRKLKSSTTYSSSSDDDLDIDPEDDQTVTARSRCAALSKLSATTACPYSSLSFSPAPLIHH